MTGPSLFAVGSALAAVLGLVALLAWAMGRFRRVAAGRRGPADLEVLSRVALAPRQGVATIRVGTRLAVVSYGEGGVRHVMDAGHVPPEAEQGLPNDRAELGLASDTVPFSKVLGRARATGLRAFSLSVVLLAGCLLLPARSLAQGAAPAPALDAISQSSSARTRPNGPGTSSAAQAVAGVIQAAPRMSLALGGVNDGDDGLKLSGPVGTVIFIGFMTLLPTLLLLTTGFARILIVLHLLKQALGTQTAPPAHLLTAMALLLTGFVMAPTFSRVHQEAIVPWMDGETDELQMLAAAAVPMRLFMLGETREQDLATFVEIRGGPAPATIDDVPFVVVTSAFVTSEMTRAFQMGFALFLPFVVIDVVVASVLMSMGMFMLPPVMVSLPFKLLLFVLVDGWALVMGSIVRSF